MGGVARCRDQDMGSTMQSAQVPALFQPDLEWRDLFADRRQTWEQDA